MYKWKDTYLKKKVEKLPQVLKDLERENSAQLPDFYISSSSKRFIKTFALFNNILGTFVGAFNAHEIRQLKIKFNKLLEQHNMLVHVTQRHVTEIIELARNMVKIVEVLNFMAEYNPGL